MTDTRKHYPVTFADGSTRDCPIDTVIDAQGNEREVLIVEDTREHLVVMLPDGTAIKLKKMLH